MNQNEKKPIKYSFCLSSFLYNNLQNYKEKSLIIDTREQNAYNKRHINPSLHISTEKVQSYLEIVAQANNIHDLSMTHLLKIFNAGEISSFSQRKRSFCVILMSDSSLPKDFIYTVQKLAGETGFEDSWEVEDNEVDSRLQALLKGTREKESILLGLQLFKILKRDKVAEVHILLEDVQQFLVNYPYMHLLFNTPMQSPHTIVDRQELNRKAKIKIAFNFPQDILKGRMFLGNFNQAEQINVIKDLGITHVLNATVECQNPHESQGIKYTKLSVLDESDKPISELFQDAYSFIENALSSDTKNKVLIHCAQGKSRSATIVIMFLMKKLKWSFDQAYSYVKKKRSYIDPNDGFVKQLKDFEKGGCEFTKVM